MALSTAGYWENHWEHQMVDCLACWKVAVTDSAKEEYWAGLWENHWGHRRADCLAYPRVAVTESSKEECWA